MFPKNHLAIGIIAVPVIATSIFFAISNAKSKTESGNYFEDIIQHLKQQQNPLTEPSDQLDTENPSSPTQSDDGDSN